MTQDKILSIRR